MSLLAGMIVDKFKYPLPLYRQHQRIQAAGITVSRSSLTNWTHDALDLLEPIYLAQLTSILDSRVLAMDETPIRAGRKSKGKRWFLATTSRILSTLMPASRIAERASTG